MVAVCAKNRRTSVIVERKAMMFLGQLRLVD